MHEKPFNEYIKQVIYDEIVIVVHVSSTYNLTNPFTKRLS